MRILLFLKDFLIINKARRILYNIVKTFIFEGFFYNIFLHNYF